MPAADITRMRGVERKCTSDGDNAAIIFTPHATRGSLRRVGMPSAARDIMVSCASEFHASANTKADKRERSATHAAASG